MTEDSSQQVLTFKKALDPRVDSIPSKTYLCNVSNSNVDYSKAQTVTANSNLISFQVHVPNKFTYVSRRMFVKYKIQVSFGTAIPAVNDCVSARQSYILGGLRAYPLASVTNRLKLQMNNGSHSIPMAEIIHAMMLFGSTPDERSKFFDCPFKADQFSWYPSGDDGIFAQSGPRNPFALFGSDQQEITRGNGIWFDPPVLEGGVVTMTSKEIIEPLFIPPCDWSGQEVEGFWGLDSSFKVEYLLNDMKHMWSNRSTLTANPGREVVNSITFVGDPELWTTFIHPPLAPTHQFPDKGCVLPYFDIVMDTDEIGPKAFGADKYSFNSRVLTYSSVPKRIYLWVAPYDTTAAVANWSPLVSIPDTFAVIEKLNITWNGVGGLLANAQIQDLHQMAVRCGSEQSFVSFRNPDLQGSVLCMRPGIDFAVSASPYVCNGSNISCQAQFYLTNINSFPNVGGRYEAGVVLKFKLYVCAVLEGTMTLANGTCQYNMGLINEEIVAQAPKIGPGDLAPHTYTGGGFGNVIKKIANVGAKIAKPLVMPLVSSLAPEFTPIAAAASPVLDAVVNATGGYRRGRSRSGRRKGGRVLSRSQLRSRAY